MKNLKKLVTYLLAICLVLPLMPSNSASAKGIKLSSKSITLSVGQTKTLKLKGTTKKPKWSSSKKSVATVTSKGKVKAKKKGNAVITAKLGKKSYKCKVKVKAKSAAPAKPTTKPTETPKVATVADNYQKLANYIQTNGKYASEDKYYYISNTITILEDEEDLYTTIQYNADGNFVFTVMTIWTTTSGTRYDFLALTITPPEYSQGAVLNSYMSDVVDFIYADGVVDLSSLSKTNTKITYTSTNAPTNVAETLYELGEIKLSMGLTSWSSLLETSGLGLTLKDLGFTSYNM